MAAKFELKKTTNDKFVFNLLASKEGLHESR